MAPFVLRNGTTRHYLRETRVYWHTASGPRETDSAGPYDICALWAAKSIFLEERHQEREIRRLLGGGGGIRTHETLSGLTVFKTAGVNRFPTPPSQ
jgi:hypothetical protein